MPFGGGGESFSPPNLKCQHFIEGWGWDWEANPRGGVPCEVPRSISNWNKSQSQLIQIRRDREDGSTTYRYCSYIAEKTKADRKLCIEFDIPPTAVAGDTATMIPFGMRSNRDGLLLDEEGEVLNGIELEKVITRFAWDFPDKSLAISDELRAGTDNHTWQVLLDFFAQTEVWTKTRSVRSDYCYSETFYHSAAAYEVAKELRKEGYNAMVLVSTECRKGNYHVYKSPRRVRNPGSWGQKKRTGPSKRHQEALMGEELRRHIGPQTM